MFVRVKLYSLIDSGWPIRHCCNPPNISHVRYFIIKYPNRTLNHSQDNAIPYTWKFVVRWVIFEPRNFTLFNIKYFM